jgi:hypothetical protein
VKRLRNYIQGVSGGNVNILGGHSIGHSEHTHGVSGGNVNILGGDSIGHSKQNVYMYMCAILNGYQCRGISLYSSLDLAPNIVLPSRM